MSQTDDKDTFRVAGGTEDYSYIGTENIHS
jgi:hypothetical protein